MGRVGFGSERVEGAGLVGVLQGEVDPVEKLRGLVHGGTCVYGRQQAHLSVQLGQTGYSTADSCWELVSTLSSPQFLLLHPVLHAPGASSQLNATQKSLR